MDKLVVSVAEAAKMLSVGRNTMYELVNSGGVESISLGRRRLIPIHALRQLVGAPEPTVTDAQAQLEAPTQPTQPPSFEGTYVLSIRKLLPGEQLIGH